MNKIADRFKSLLLRRVFSTLLLLIFAIGFLTPYRQKICEKDPYSGQQNCSAYHISMFIVLRMGEFCNDYAGAISALSGVAVAYFTYTLWRTSNRQADLTRDSISEAAEGTKAATRAAIATENAGHSDRAWMVFEGANINQATNVTTEKGPGQRGVSVEIRWINAGRTPAISTIAFTTHKELFVTGNIPFFETPNMPELGAAIGQGRITSGQTCFVEESVMQGVFDGTAEVWIYSKIKYHTVFDEKKIRFSEYCARVSYNGHAFDPVNQEIRAQWGGSVGGPQNTCT